MRLSASEVRRHSKIIKQVWDDNTAQKYVEFLREKKPSYMYLRRRFHFSCFFTTQVQMNSFTTQTEEQNQMILFQIIEFSASASGSKSVIIFPRRLDSILIKKPYKNIGLG